MVSFSSHANGYRSQLQAQRLVPLLQSQQHPQRLLPQVTRSSAIFHSSETRFDGI
jgi:hypothetical protein